MAKSKPQLRVQLSFRRSDEDHLRAYRYLKSRADRTEYVVGLILADMLGDAIEQGTIVETGEPAAAVTPEVDYGRLIEMLQPTLAMLVKSTVAKAIDELPVAAHPASGSTEQPAPEKSEDADISLALEGLKAFGDFEAPFKEGDAEEHE